MEIAVTTGAIIRAKLQSNHHHQQTNIQFFTGQMANQQCQSTEWKNITFHGLAYPQLTWGSSNFVWPLIAPGYLGESCHAISSLSSFIMISDASTQWCCMMLHGLIIWCKLNEWTLNNERIRLFFCTITKQSPIHLTVPACYRHGHPLHRTLKYSNNIDVQSNWRVASFRATINVSREEGRHYAIALVKLKAKKRTMIMKDLRISPGLFLTSKIYAWPPKVS